MVLKYVPVSFGFLSYSVCLPRKCEQEKKKKNWEKILCFESDMSLLFVFFVCFSFSLRK